jgi:hypothetical protein
MTEHCRGLVLSITIHLQIGKANIMGRIWKGILQIIIIIIILGAIVENVGAMLSILTMSTFEAKVVTLGGCIMCRGPLAFSLTSLLAPFKFFTILLFHFIGSGRWNEHPFLMEFTTVVSILIYLFVF